MQLSEALAQAALSRGAQPDLIKAWRDNDADPLSGTIDALTARVVAYGPLEIAGDLLTVLESAMHALQAGPQEAGDDGPAQVPPKVGDVLALAKAYADMRDRGLADLAIQLPNSP